jgi:branched-chain amino acid transport system substrate-binding protein
MFGFWNPNNGNVGGQTLYDAAKARFGEGLAAQGFVACYAMVQVLADAIARAGSAEPDAIAKALGQTRDLPTVLARITIGADHWGLLPLSAVQWQGERQVTVWPPDQATGTFEAPVKGLAR